MEETKRCLYFRKLRMIYCREEQFIELLPDLISEATQPQLRDTMARYLSAGRCRRYLIKDLAWDHGIAPQGEECLAMRKVVAVGCARLASASRGERHDVAVEGFCHELHRVVMVDYRLTRNYAIRENLHVDIACFDEVIASMVDAFPESLSRDPSRHDRKLHETGWDASRKSRQAKHSQDLVSAGG